MTLQITEAIYYTSKKSVEVTEQIRDMVKNNSLEVIANNDIAGDPHYGTVKKLVVRYVQNGKYNEKTVREGATITIRDKEQVPPPNLRAVPAHPAPFIPPKDKPSITDIIIPTYNNEQLTIACFESIKECTSPGSYRIIWVDNGSKEYKKAKAALKGVDHIAVMLKKNTGFVGAINTGLAKSDAPTVCLLNNDTEVSPRWLDKLTDVLYSDPNIGIVGPLTGPPARNKQYDSHHNIAYQQLHRDVPVFPYYKTLADFNMKIEAMHSGLTGDIQFIAFLCAVMKREVIEKVTEFHPSYANGLDTGYDMGMWDDCDYNWAIEKVGYKVRIALDTCIIHKGRSTFNLIQKEESFDVNSLLKKNRKYMDKKRKQIENDS